MPLLLGSCWSPVPPVQAGPMPLVWGGGGVGGAVRGCPYYWGSVRLALSDFARPDPVDIDYDQGSANMGPAPNSSTKLGPTWAALCTVPWPPLQGA